MSVVSFGVLVARLAEGGLWAIVLLALGTLRTGITRFGHRFWLELSALPTGWFERLAGYLPGHTTPLDSRAPPAGWLDQQLLPVPVPTVAYRGRNQSPARSS